MLTVLEKFCVCFVPICCMKSMRVSAACVRGGGLRVEDRVLVSVSRDARYEHELVRATAVLAASIQGMVVQVLQTLRPLVLVLFQLHTTRCWIMIALFCEASRYLTWSASVAKYCFIPRMPFVQTWCCSNSASELVADAPPQLASSQSSNATPSCKQIRNCM